MANDLFKSDRDFNDDLIEQRGMFVAQHNDLVVRADYDLSARELKIMDYLISLIKPDDKRFNVVHTSLYEIAKVLGLKRSGQTYNQISENLRELRRKEVMILGQGDKGRSITITGWISEPTFHENGQLEILISEKFMPFLLDLRNTGNYTQHLLFDTVKLDSKYSIRLYKLMREANKDKGRTCPVLKGSPEELKVKLSAPESYSWSDLRKNVLLPAIKEINLKIDDMDLQMNTGKRGRNVVHVEIYNNFYPIKAGQDKENSIKNPVPMINWLKDLQNDPQVSSYREQEGQTGINDFINE